MPVHPGSHSMLPLPKKLLVLFDLVTIHAVIQHNNNIIKRAVNRATKTGEWLVDYTDRWYSVVSIIGFANVDVVCILCGTTVPGVSSK